MCSSPRQFGCIIFFVACRWAEEASAQRSHKAAHHSAVGIVALRALSVCVHWNVAGHRGAVPAPACQHREKEEKKATKASEPRTGLDGICVVGPPLERDGVVDRCARKYGQAGQAVARNQNGNELAPQWQWANGRRTQFAKVPLQWSFVTLSKVSWACSGCLGL